MYTFWIDLYRANLVSWFYAHSDNTTFMKYADNGMNGSHVIPNIPGC